MAQVELIMLLAKNFEDRKFRPDYFEFAEFDHIHLVVIVENL